MMAMTMSFEVADSAMLRVKEDVGKLV